MYRCLQCGKEIELESINDKIRCPYCGYRIAIKKRPKTPTKVPAV